MCSNVDVVVLLLQLIINIFSIEFQIQVDSTLHVKVKKATNQAKNQGNKSGYVWMHEI